MRTPPPKTVVPREDDVDAQLSTALRSSPPPQQRAAPFRDLPLPAFIVNEFLSPNECAQLIALSEGRGYEAAQINIGGGRQVTMNDVRRSSRCIIDCPQVAESLYERLQPHLQKLGLENGPNGGWRRCTGLNERLRFLKYDPGDHFALHTDGRYVRPIGDPRGEGDESLMTLMLYLNTPQKGGETTFIPDRGGRRRDVRPTSGLCLCFDHNLLHQGGLLVEGVKYAIRTDLMFTRRPEPPPAAPAPAPDRTAEQAC